MIDRLRGSAVALRAVFANRDLRRIELALLGSMLGTWSYTLALAVYAYRSGGASAVALAAVVRWIPAAVAAPWMSILGDRLERRRVMLGADLTRIGLMSGMGALALGGGPHALVYALAACSAICGTAFRPAQSALLPALARTPDELTAANVVATTIESVGFFGGPALGGLLLAATSPGWVFFANGGALLWSALNVWRISGEHDRRGAGTTASFWSTALAGFSTIVSESRVRLLMGMFAVQVMVDGALGVLVVILALRRLDVGSSGLGFLNGAMGVGGVVGGVVAAALVGRRRLAGDFGSGILLWGLPIALIGVWPREWLALLALALVGIGNTIVDVAGMTLLQRSVPDEVLARVFGVMETVIYAAASTGALLAPVGYHTLGLRTTLVLTGVLLPALALAAAPTLRAIDAESAPAAGLERLRSIPFLTLLPEPALESLAGKLVPVRVAAGEDVLRQGEPGDRFYVIDSGEVEIAGHRHGPGGYFGEIALLRDVPRTATVRAVTDVELLALERDDFIGAVTGHAPSAEAADSVIGARLPALSG